MFISSTLFYFVFHNVFYTGWAGRLFTTLNEMVTEAQSYGAVASFGKPSLDADSLSNIVSSLASSLTTSKTEMSELKTGNMEGGSNGCKERETKYSRL